MNSIQSITAHKNWFEMRAKKIGNDVHIVKSIITRENRQ